MATLKVSKMNYNRILAIPCDLKKINCPHKMATLKVSKMNYNRICRFLVSEKNNY